VVTLNFYPSSSDAGGHSELWLPSTDGAKMMTNALLFDVFGNSLLSLSFFSSLVLLYT
jgi:hypothetical protein